MIEEIKNKYGTFSDASVCEIKYFNRIGTNRIPSRIEMLIRCMNAQKNDDYEMIKLTFIDVRFFRFVDIGKGGITAIFDALLKRENDMIVMDFSPTMMGGDEMEENPLSDFIIKCDSISYEEINQL